MRTKVTKSKKTKKSAERSRKGSVCELCAHEDDTPCGTTCVKGLDNPFVTNVVCYERRSPHLTAFYCQCAQLHGEVHRLTQQSVSETFQEDVVSELGDKVLARLHKLLEDATTSGSDGDDDDSAPPLCPFVMLLSIFLPSLRKYLDWVVKTRLVWAFSDTSTSATSSCSLPASATHLQSSPPLSGSSSTALLAMTALHDALMRVTLECEKLSLLIELNESVDDEQLAHARAKPAAGVSSASASSSAGGILAVPAGTGTAPGSMRIPQVKKISLEFEELVAEYKCQLAELTESILEATETSASQMCRPLMTKDATKSRGSVTEYMELLVLQLLNPIRKRAIASPSPSRTYLAPRILERCISVAMEEFVLDNVKMNEILAAQFEKGVTFLRSWCLQFEVEYNNVFKTQRVSISHHNPESQVTVMKEALAEAQAPPSRSVTQPLRLNIEAVNSGGDGSSSRANTSETDRYGAGETAPPERLQLVGLDGFKRLENVLNTWLRGSPKIEDEALSARSRVKANLGGLRTIARSITTRTR